MAKIIPIDQGKIRLPGPRDRVTVIGPTGSGKTHAALWHLSHATFDVRPYVIIDPKREELIAQIDGAEYVDIGEIPKQPGIYVINPIPSDAPLVDEYLMQIWDHENVGIWMDESLQFGNTDGVDAVLTQGRSKRIPVIMLMQRPTWVSRFAVSEATFIQYFGLYDKRDQAIVRGFAENLPVEIPLEQYHSFYYDVPKRRNYHFKPMPDANTILDRINARLDNMKPQRKII